MASQNTEPSPSKVESDEWIAVDGICVGCKETSLHHILKDKRDWEEGSTFRDACKQCGVVEHHNIVAFLDGLNNGRAHGQSSD